MESAALPGPEKIVSKWLKRASRIQNRHYDASASLMRWHYGTGAPLVVLSVIEGSSLLLKVSEVDFVTDTAAAIVTGFIGLLVAVLAAMQAFMSFETRSRLHYDAGVKYGAIKRKLEAVISSAPSGEHVASTLDTLAPEWDSLAEESPPIPHSVWQRAERRDKNGK